MKKYLERKSQRNCILERKNSKKFRLRRAKKKRSNHNYQIRHAFTGKKSPPKGAKFFEVIFSMYRLLEKIGENQKMY